MERLVSGRLPSTYDRENPVDREFISLSDITDFLRLYARSIAGCLAIGILGAAFYVITTDNVYTARTQILIETKIPQLLRLQATEVNLSLDTAQVESQIVVMKSEKIAMMVVDELNLMDDPTFNQPKSPTLAERFAKFGMFVGKHFGFEKGEHADSLETGETEAHVPEAVDNTASKDAEFERRRLTIATFQDALDVRRLGVSYAIEIAFRSRDAELAAKIANATANAHVREQLDTKAAAAREGAAWLEKRLAQMRNKMNTATQIAQEFRSRHDYSVSRQPETAAADEGAAKGRNATIGEGEPTLEELEVTAETYRKIYESFLEAYTSSVSDQSYPVADARVITPAHRPLSASHPRRKLVMIFGALLGTMAGVGQAFIRHTFDRTLRTARQVREQLGLECIGELPSLGRRRLSSRMEEVARSPHSPFSYSMRRAKTAIDLAATASPIKWLGITSPDEGEGKCLTASNLAATYAMCGHRVLVIDADDYHPELTNLLLTGSRTGSKLPSATGPAMRSTVPIPNLKFDLLPSTSLRAQKLHAPKNMHALLEEFGSYDIIIVVLPNFTSGADSMAVSSVLDGVLLVGRWRRTSLDLLSELVRSMHANKALMVGLLMTGVRARGMVRRIWDFSRVS